MAHDRQENRQENRQEIEVIRREADGTWSRHVAGAGQSARLASIACDLAVAEIYRDPLAGDGGATA